MHVAFLNTRSYRGEDGQTCVCYNKALLTAQAAGPAAEVADVCASQLWTQPPCHIQACLISPRGALHSVLWENREYSSKPVGFLSLIQGMALEIVLFLFL